MVAQGKSQTMNSRHLTGNAADIFIQNPDGSANWDFEAYRPVAEIAKEVAAEKGYDDLVWGGDWKTLKDGVHFQMGGAAVAGGAGSASAGAGGGTMGGNVEDILAQLYPQMSPEDEQRQRRKDFFAAASQGLSALSQGRPIDFSNIQANQENRKRQAVLDMRERERARSAASLVFSQTGDRDLAAGIATGAISYGDVVSERERKRVEAEADRQRVATEQANGRLTGIVEKMWPDLGLPDSVKESVLAGIAAGDDPNTIFTLNEQAKVAEVAREADEEEAASAATRAAAIEAFSTEGGPIEQYAARLLALDPALTVDQALERSTTLMRPAGQEGFTLKPGETRFGPGGEQIAALPEAAGGDKSFQFQAEIDARVQNLGEDVATATRAVLNKPEAAGYSVVGLPGGGVMVVPSSAAGAPAQAAPAAVGAPMGVAGAFNQQFGGMETGIPTGAPAVAAQAIPLDVAQDVATLESTMAQTAQRKQDLELALETAPDDIARAAIEADLAAVNLEQAQLNLQTAQSSAEPDAALKALSVQKAEEDLIAAELENEERRRKMAGTEDEAATEEEKAVRRELRAMQSTDTVMREGTKLLDLTKDWKSGVVPGLLATGARLLSQSETGRAERLMAGIKDNIALDNLIAMKQDSPTGGALGSVSNAEGERLENRFGSLDVTGNTTDLRDNVGAAMNAYNDAIHGTPAQILELYENGEITAEQADAYSTRLVSSLDKDTATLMTENGPATNLGLSTNRDTIYGLAKSVTGEEPGLTQEERDLFETFKQ
jgi:hypothetical protein